MAAIPFPPVTGSSLINPGEASCVLNPSYSGSFYCRQFFPHGVGYGFEPVYPYWMPTVGYESDQSAPPPAEVVGQEPPLAAAVGNLASEVELMREEQAERDARSAPAAQVPAAPEEKSPPTVFIYRDGHQMEADNYAILGQTLYIFAGQGTRRIALADLDLPATARANEKLGVDFTAPVSP